MHQIKASGVFCLALILFSSAPSLHAEAKKENKLRLAVMDLEAVNVDKQTAVTISDLIRTEVFNTGFFIVTERKEMQNILKEQSFQMSGLADTKSARVAGKLLSADRILVGTVNKLGNIFIMNVRMVDVETGTVGFALKQTVEREELMAEGCEMLAKNLVSKVRDDRIGDTVARAKKPWEACAEFGAGNLFTLGLSFYNIGLSTGFDLGTEEVEGTEYNSSLVHFGLFYSLNLMPLLPKKIPGQFLAVFRPKAGYNFVMLDKYYTGSYEISGQVLLGYYDFYALLSPSYLICKDGNILIFQLGIGYRIRF